MYLVIHKQILDLTQRQTLSIPRNAEILSIQNQNENIYLWYICNPDNKLISRTFLLFGTGEREIPEDKIIGYLDTVIMQNNNFVWHIFEEL
jgi:hypothetical protein